MCLSMTHCLFQMSSSKEKCHLNDLGTNFLNVRNSYERNFPSYGTICSRQPHPIDDMGLFGIGSDEPIEPIITMESSEIYVEFNADEAPKEEDEQVHLSIEAFEETQMSQFVKLKRLPMFSRSNNGFRQFPYGY